MFELILTRNSWKSATYIRPGIKGIGICRLGDSNVIAVPWQNIGLF
jgi:hypothetical protein